jgi:GH25 family lysozyme M1 (1,4-beta-N-acetylmuramidase)
MCARRGLTYLLGLLAVGVAIAHPPSVADSAKPPVGIDVSRFQGAIKWKRAATKGKVGFAFVQASRGSGFDCAVAPDRCGADEFYARNQARARLHGVRVGPYHRAFAGGEGIAGVTADATAEADLFISVVSQSGGLQPGDLRPALDVETPFGGLNATELQTWIRTWLGRVESALGARPIIYTNDSSWGATGDTIEFADAGHPLWVAHWGVAAPRVPASFWGGNGWSVWQYSSSGRVKGIKGRVDLDRLGPAGFAPIAVGS